MRLHLVVSCTIVGALHCGASQHAPKWGAHTLKGWWNPLTSGRIPQTTLAGYDYVVVGSGAGGAPLAARLGLAGHSVLVIEAGDDTAQTDHNATVPYFNALASEDPQLSWSFYVDHYPDLARNARDWKYLYKLQNGSLHMGPRPPAGATPLGHLYPRTAALGGCINHNALIMMYPLEEDWNALARLTQDQSWNAVNMRRYFERLEQCQYLPIGTPGHGFDGWLATNRADPSIFLNDDKVFSMLKAAAKIAGNAVHSVADLLALLARDLNVGSAQYDTERGLYNAPLSMDGNTRSTPREFLLNTRELLNKRHRRKGRIDIRLNCLVSRVIFEPGSQRAVGVEFLDGKSLYRADPRASTHARSGRPGVAFAAKEVILAGGAYNTPQLLKLSGVGPAVELAEHGIPLIVDLPGVGNNLQDRIENSVISDASQPWTVWQGCTSGHNDSDPCLREWQTERTNRTKYATNGRPAHIPMRSQRNPSSFNDVVVTGRPGYFGGYFPGYSRIGSQYPNSWTWPVLKAYTQNRAGIVRLRSADPRETPYINFNYLEAGSGDWSYDVDAVVEGIQLGREIFATFAQETNTIVNELRPGSKYDSQRALQQWVKETSWGHHASCSCPMGADEDVTAVLDSEFRVRGTYGLRVVDASVFPHIPGFYIQTSIFMVSEKAADVIVRDAHKITPSCLSTHTKGSDQE